MMCSSISLFNTMLVMYENIDTIIILRCVLVRENTTWFILRRVIICGIYQVQVSINVNYRVIQ